jgi:imidazole glycerol-phosphate synthase subunit HisH
MNIALVKYNAGNIQSVLFALARLGITPTLTDNAEQLRSADKVIFPGVGSANAAMKSLQESGLDRVIPTLSNPVLGICVGMQLMCAFSEEQDTQCMGIFPQSVKKFTSNSLKIPQMGWNTIEALISPLFLGIAEQSYVYYVHSYAAELNEFTIATTQYGNAFSAALHRDNFYGVQFHPEKSADVGAKILENFLIK